MRTRTRAGASARSSRAAEGRFCPSRFQEELIKNHVDIRDLLAAHCGGRRGNYGKREGQLALDVRSGTVSGNRDGSPSLASASCERAKRRGAGASAASAARPCRTRRHRQLAPHFLSQGSPGSLPGPQRAPERGRRRRRRPDRGASPSCRTPPQSRRPSCSPKSRSSRRRARARADCARLRREGPGG